MISGGGEKNHSTFQEWFFSPPGQTALTPPVVFFTTPVVFFTTPEARDPILLQNAIKPNGFLSFRVQTGPGWPGVWPAGGPEKG